MKLSAKIVLLVFVASQVWAESAEHATHEAGHGHGVTVPGWSIFWQVFNLTILFGALIYLLRRPVRDYFAKRKEGFVEAAKKSQIARAEAEKEYLDILHKIEHLESTRAESIARAEAEAVDMQKQMVRDAQDMAVRIRREAETTILVENQKAKLELHEKFVRETISAARGVLTKDIGGQDHQKLQADFVEHMKAVSP